MKGNTLVPQEAKSCTWREKQQDVKAQQTTKEKLFQKQKKQKIFQVLSGLPLKAQLNWWQPAHGKFSAQSGLFKTESDSV